MTYQHALLDPETYVNPARRGQCPVISRVDDTLWFGGVMNGMLLPTRFKHVVSLFPAEMYAIGHATRSFTIFPFEDIEALPPEPVLIGLADWVNACRDDAPTLVHCQAGLNRSALVVALALIQAGDRPEDAIGTLRAIRDPQVLFNRAFADWLMDRPVPVRP